jgi:hypothetical protein
MYQNKTPAAGTVTGFGVSGPYGTACATGTRCTSYEQVWLELHQARNQSEQLTLISQ